jgi:NADH-quinone oxidoreductase subunit M
MFPFHTWLPAAHVEAPTAGSVILASVLLKMGTYGFLRFCLPITPYAHHVISRPMSSGSPSPASSTAVSPPWRRATSKSSSPIPASRHMGFATLGIFALNNGIEGAVLVMINHGVTTGALFICVGIIYERLHTRDLAEGRRHRQTMPIFAFFLGVFCLSSLAFPGTNSFIGEFLVLPAASRFPRSSSSAPCPASSPRPPTISACSSASFTAARQPRPHRQ